MIGDQTNISSVHGVESPAVLVGVRHSCRASQKSGLSDNRTLAKPTPDSRPNESVRGGGILFYDGECGLCTRSVRFFLWADKRKRLRFAPLQGKTAEARLPANLREADCLSTVVYLRSAAEPLLRSEAVAVALVDIGGFWRPVGRCILLFPLRLREAAYRFVAKNRFKVFRRGACALPTPDERERMLD